jgi:hypothetical protein
MSIFRQMSSLFNEDRRRLMGLSGDLGDHDGWVGPVRYVAGRGSADGMDAAFGWDRD